MCVCDLSQVSLHQQLAMKGWLRVWVWPVETSKVPQGSSRPAAHQHTTHRRTLPPHPRMVNGIADSQQKGRVAVSVNSLAEAAGLSRLLVDVRHEATHNELPSLSTLQLAARQALDWLIQQYWCVREGRRATWWPP